MNNEEFEAHYPLILSWIQHTLARYAPQAQTVAALGFRRLPDYFQSKLLAETKVVAVEIVPTPPLSKIGLGQFAEFENMRPDGITYLDTFFVRDECRRNEAHYFHELVHVIQWQILGPKRFIAAYADGLERNDYRKTPLEIMAYTLDSVFRNSTNPFDVAKVVQEQLKEMDQGR
jgi:hypothetical protein